MYRVCPEGREQRAEMMRNERKSKWNSYKIGKKKKEREEEVFCNRMSGVTDGSDSGGAERKGRDQRTMTQCARSGDNRRGNRGRGQRVKGERGQRKQRTSTAQHHAQPSQRMLIQAFQERPNPHPL